MRIDIHQHVWTTPLLDRLAVRHEPPFVRRSDGVTMLHSTAEPPYLIDVCSEAPERRASLVKQDGLDIAVVALSSPIGIEALPRDCALELIDAHLEGVDRLPEGFVAWGPVALDGAGSADVDGLLERGCVGISLCAGALAGPDRLEQIHALLDRAASRGAPVFVHPGRAPGQRASAVEFGEPLWWRPLTDYVSQMQAAWLTFAALGRREHPELKIVFAMLAGGAPLLSERLACRGGPEPDLLDPNTYYETSSYGPAAVEMMASRVGADQLVYGSDRPVVVPVPMGRELEFQANAAELLSDAPVVAESAAVAALGAWA